VTPEAHFPIATEADMVVARQKGREMAQSLGFPVSEQALIATAISELTRNMLKYAGRGELALAVEHDGGRRAIVVVAADQGPGIVDPERALQDGYSSGDGLGLGLPGTRRIMDEFELATELGKGTRITAKKWIR
jgi:serine/threonine-protein kinase RsbT